VKRLVLALLLLLPAVRASVVVTYWTPRTVFMASDSRAAMPDGTPLPDVHKITRHGRFLIGVTGLLRAPGFDLLAIVAAADGNGVMKMAEAILAAARPQLAALPAMGVPAAFTVTVAGFEDGRPVVVLATLDGVRRLPGASGYLATGHTAAIDASLAPMLSRGGERALPALIQTEAAADTVYVGGPVQMLQLSLTEPRP
jgi:hypothetical protein